MWLFDFSFKWDVFLYSFFIFIKSIFFQYQNTKNDWEYQNQSSMNIFLLFYRNYKLRLYNIKVSFTTQIQCKILWIKIDCIGSCIMLIFILLTRLCIQEIFIAQKKLFLKFLRVILLLYNLLVYFNIIKTKLIKAIFIILLYNLI